MQALGRLQPWAQVLACIGLSRESNRKACGDGDVSRSPTICTSRLRRYGTATYTVRRSLSARPFNRMHFFPRTLVAGAANHQHRCKALTVGRAGTESLAMEWVPPSYLSPMTLCPGTTHSTAPAVAQIVLLVVDDPTGSVGSIHELCASRASSLPILCQPAGGKGGAARK